MSIHPKVPIQTEKGSACRPRWQLPPPSLGPSPTTRSPGSVPYPHPPPPGWRGYPEVSYIKPNVGKWLPGKWGLSARLLMHPILLRFLLPSFSPCDLPSSPACGLLLHPVHLSLSFPCCLCHLFPKSQRSSLWYPPHHCTPLSREPQRLPLPAHSVMLPVGRAHVFPSGRRTLSLPVSFPVPFSWAQPE